MLKKGYVLQLQQMGHESSDQLMVVGEDKDEAISQEALGCSDAEDTSLRDTAPVMFSTLHKLEENSQLHMLRYEGLTDWLV